VSEAIDAAETADASLESAFSLRRRRVDTERFLISPSAVPEGETQ